MRNFHADEKKVGRLGFALVERVDVMAQLSKNACLQGGCQEAVEGRWVCGGWVRWWALKSFNNVASMFFFYMLHVFILN